MTYLRLQDAEVKGKKVLVRVGMDMPMDDEGNITDDLRINISIPTIRHLLEGGAAQIILMSHIDRPKERDPRLSTRKTAERLTEILGRQVTYLDNWGERGIPDERIVFLENVRFRAEEKSKDADQRDRFARQLASLADLYVCDAFNNSHHPNQASMAGVLKYIPGCMGMCPEREISIINQAMENPEKPFVSVIGGMKAEKLNAVKSLLGKVDKILVGGALAFALLRSMGKEAGSTKIDEEGLEEMKDLAEAVRNSSKVVLPVDAVIADRFDEQAETDIVGVDHLRKGWMALDIGPKTLQIWQAILKDAKTVIFNGPPGVYELDKFARGTKMIVETMANLPDATTVVGGGDSADSIKKFGQVEKMTLVSSGGGASLEMFMGKKLGMVAALEENYEKFKGKV